MLLSSKNLRKSAPRSVTGSAKTGSASTFQMALLDRAHQQAAVAALGQAALTGVELTTLLEQAVVFVTQTLSLDFASIYELAEDQGSLRLIAGFGWNHGVVGQTTLLTAPDSMLAHVLGSNGPVITRDLRNTTEFVVPDFVRNHGAVSGISLIIPGQSQPWGILEAHSRRSRTFDEDDFHFLQSVANIITTAQARKQSELDHAHLAAFVEHNPNPVIELAAAGQVIYCNDAARLMVQALERRQPSELLPANLSDILHRCLDHRRSALHEQAEVAGRTLSWSFFPITRLGRVHGYAVDITERLSLEAQLRQSQKMEAIGQLAAGVAHDFNNILTIMQGLVRRLGVTASHEQNEMLDQVYETTERASGLTRQLLAFSRRQVLQRQVLSLGKVVGNMSRMLQRLIGEDITLEVEQAEEVPSLEADTAMMEQILMNLAVNARDAMPRGGRLRIKTDMVSRSNGIEPVPWVRLRVRDTGCGMSPEVQARIFEPFYTTKELGKGTGLGLATVFGIVKQHAGLIEVESTQGQGTTFTILFPPTDKVLESKTEFITKKSLKRGAGETILLVEDEPILRELAQVILVDGGYKVLEAGQSEEALAIWEQHQGEIDLLLTDMVLPGELTGRELALKLQKLKPALKVVYSTGYSPDGLDVEGAAYNFLQKPYPPEMLMRTVRTSLDS